MKKTVPRTSARRPAVKRMPVRRASDVYQNTYAWVSLAVLLSTSWYWARLGALIQQNNADQLVNGYLFESVSTFTQAIFPAQHSFLLKWPLFLLTQVLGASRSAFVAITIATVLLTVGLFAALLYKIERRPLLFGSLCLALASCLLLIPAQPFPGALLPVNMAMLTTRNLEYIVMLGSLLLLANTKSYKSWGFAGGVSLLLILFASDKLFLGLSIGGAVLASVTYWLTKTKAMRQLSLRWLLMSILAAIGAYILVAVINASGLTSIQGDSGASPYTFVQSPKLLLIALAQMLLGIGSVLGISPIDDSRLLSEVFGRYVHGLIGWQGIAYSVNTIVVGIGIYGLYRYIRRSFARPASVNSDGYYKLAVMLVWTTIAACLVFVFTNHYHPVDARYLAIALFAVFVGLALLSRRLKHVPPYALLVAVTLVASTLIGIGTAQSNYYADQYAMRTEVTRNDTIAKAIKYHPVKTVVGDYWRVVPARLAADQGLHIAPLSDCFTPSETLNSKTWNADSGSFAYLLSSEKSSTGFGGCSIDAIVQHYGRPNASTLIAGSLDKPKELLLFYDAGVRPRDSASATAPLPQTHAPPLASIVPVPLDQLRHLTCNTSTIMSVVAHQDDDLLFMNPDLISSLHAKQCVRSVYMTAGDAGADSLYWLSREQATEAAYNTMIGHKDIWIKRLAQLPNGQFITVDTPRDDPYVSLIFFRLPDGNVNGSGFSTSAYQSLEHLLAGKINNMDAVDGQSSYTANDIVSGLTALMNVYQPSSVRTQANDYDKRYPDHSDHIAVGKFTDQAYASYKSTQSAPESQLFHYKGYPIHGLQKNLSDSIISKKEDIFRAYSNFDHSVCEAINPCRFSPSYRAYISRQYRIEP